MDFTLQANGNPCRGEVILRATQPFEVPGHETFEDMLRSHGSAAVDGWSEHRIGGGDGGPVDPIVASSAVNLAAVAATVAPTTSSSLKLPSNVDNIFACQVLLARKLNAADWFRMLGK
jgi:hypothetical protein